MVTTKPYKISVEETRRITRRINYGIFGPKGHLVLFTLLLVGAYFNRWYIPLAALHLGLLLILEARIFRLASRKLIDANECEHVVTFEIGFMVAKSSNGSDGRCPLSQFSVAIVDVDHIRMKHFGNLFSIIPLRAFESNEDIQTVLQMLQDAGVKVKDRRQSAIAG